MRYERIVQMRDELKHIKSNFVSIAKEDYNSLLRIVEEDTVCVDFSSEIEFDVTDLKTLVERCIKFYD